MRHFELSEAILIVFTYVLDMKTFAQKINIPVALLAMLAVGLSHGTCLAQTTNESIFLPQVDASSPAPTPHKAKKKEPAHKKKKQADDEITSPSEDHENEDAPHHSSSAATPQPTPEDSADYIRTNKANQ